MPVKRLFITVTVLFNLLIPFVVQAQQMERPIVRLIYFLPSDRAPQPDFNTKMDRLIKDVQEAYAGIMEAHGFGRKTFHLETDRHGNAVVHHIRGKFNDAHYHNPSWAVWDEIEEHFDLSKNIYLTALEISTAIDKGYCGLGASYGGSTGRALIPASGICISVFVTAHELGHAFGLNHDNRGQGKWIVSGSVADRSITSFCAAEWLDAHRCFNVSQGPPAGSPPRIKMLSSNFISPPNVIRLRFEVSNRVGLHQAQLHTPEGGFIGCKALNGRTNAIVEFVTTELSLQSKEVSLSMIDVDGNFSFSQPFPLDIRALLPPSKVISIPDVNLAAAVRETLELAPREALTTDALSNLIDLDAGNRGITDLTGLEHAHFLVTLNLGGKYINGRTVNSNTVSNVSPLSGLTKLKHLDFSDSFLSDVSFLAELTQQLVLLDLSNNNISDVTPLTGFTHLEKLRLGNNNISDVTPLENLIELVELWLDNNNISDVTPLAELTQLVLLDLSNNNISDVTPLAELTYLTWLLQLSNNNISDVTPLENLIRLKVLNLWENNISDVTPLAELTQLELLNLSSNSISDVSSLVELNLPGTEWDSTGLHLEGNLLNYASINRHIPKMQTKGVEVKFTPRTPTTLIKRLGDAQQSKPHKALPTPLVVEIKDENGIPLADVPIRFTVTAGGGKVHPTKTRADTTGRAQATLTLGPKFGKNTVRVTATEIQKAVFFTATATDNPPPTFRKPTTFSVAENTTAIGRVKATDVDKQDRVTGYTINPAAGEDSEKFSITSTGGLRFKTPPDYERPTTASRNNEYIVLVSATSGTEERMRTGTEPFTITVTNVDEPPNVPAAPTVIPASPTSLLLSWSAPTNTGPSMTYEVRYRISNTGKFIKANYNGAKTIFILRGLSNGKKYQVQVRAKNDEGSSAWSRSGTGIPKVGQPTPETPINFSDPFEGTALQNPNWQWQNEPANWDIGETRKNFLHIESETNRDLWVSDASHFLYQIIDADAFDVETHFFTRWDTFSGVNGLVVKSPLDNDWVTLKFWARDPGWKGQIQYQARGRGLVGDPAWQPKFGATELFFRLRKDGNIYTGWYKTREEDSWIKIGYANVALTPPLQLGIYAGVAAPTGILTVDYEYFRSIVNTTVQAAPTLNASTIVIPTETAILPNYPNPFNPETWIPYQLTEPAEVTLTIYAVDGHVVRQLVLGHQPAGMYHSKSRAAYWDGRNEQGESVASGVYFYTLIAGDFTATRKMLIRK